MIEFQEGRTYLWIYSYTEFDVAIAVGDIDGDVLEGNDGGWYSLKNIVGPLTRAEYDRACSLIVDRNVSLVIAGQATTHAEYVASKLIDLWRELA